MNPFDELSIEEAIRLRERKVPIQEIVAFSAGPALHDVSPGLSLPTSRGESDSYHADNAQQRRRRFRNKFE